jgi:hypothetical protein
MMENLTGDQLKKFRCLSIEDIQRLYETTNHRKEFWDKLGELVIERAGEEKKSEWVKVEDEELEDNQWYWIYILKYKEVKYAAFMIEDSFLRKDMFITSDGGYVSKDGVSHVIPYDEPQPPIQ